jgi:DNA-binding CsgD family transcriptional regulator
MSFDTAYSPVTVSPAPAAFVLPKVLSITDRRNRPRRASDEKQSSLAALAGWFVSRQRQPIIAFDNRKKVLLINEGGQRFLESVKTISLVNNHLVFKSDRICNVVEQALATHIAPPSVQMRVGGHNATLDIKVLKLSDGVKLFIATMTSEQVMLPDYDTVREEFGLTHAEFVIAVGIYNGLSLAKIAKERDASVNTVKTQTKQLFQKCRVHSQVELTRKLGQFHVAP